MKTKSTLWALLLAAFAGADPQVYIHPDGPHVYSGTSSSHLRGGAAHNVHRHDEECARGVVVNCQVEEGWAWSASTTTCGQGNRTRSRAITVTVSERCVRSLV